VVRSADAEVRLVSGGAVVEGEFVGDGFVEGGDV
jgi:hypothetical protein